MSETFNRCGSVGSEPSVKHFRLTCLHVTSLGLTGRSTDHRPAYRIARSGRAMTIGQSQSNKNAPDAHKNFSQNLSGTVVTTR